MGRQYVTLKVLSPVHIGSGDEFSPAEYFFSQGKCHILDVPSLLKDAAFQPYFEKYLENTAEHLPVAKYVPEEILQRHIRYSLPAVGKAVEKLAHNALSIRTVIKSAEGVIVPGSSIKGSILSAMIWYVLEKQAKKNNRIREILENTLKRRQGRSRQKDVKTWDNKAMLKYVMPKLGNTGNKAFTAWLRVSDSFPLPVHEAVEVRCAEVEGSRSRRRNQSALPILYEALKPGVTFRVEVDTSMCLHSWDDILDALFGFYNAVYDKDISRGIDSEWEPDEDAVLLRLGQGSTAFATSLLVLAEDLKIDYYVKAPVTRKRIDGIPMGWMEVLES